MSSSGDGRVPKQYTLSLDIDVVNGFDAAIPGDSSRSRVLENLMRQYVKQHGDEEFAEKKGDTA